MQLELPFLSPLPSYQYEVKASDIPIIGEVQLRDREQSHTMFMSVVQIPLPAICMQQLQIRSASLRINVTWNMSGWTLVMSPIEPDQSP